MLIIQVICISILSMPISIEKIYSELTSYQIKNAKRVLIENILATFVVLLALMNTSTSFYLFTLTGSVFRKELKSLFFSNRRLSEVEPSAIANARAKTRDEF
jgi:ABC-type microcin C transport system permease subunit YejB